MKSFERNKDSRFSTVAGWCWLAVVLIGLLSACQVRGAELQISRVLQASVCRVTNEFRGSSSLGSGTLIDKASDGSEGLVLTCAHLFREGVGELTVAFADGRTHRATLIDVDHRADLAALAIARPLGRPAEVVLEMSSWSRLHACGYGPHGAYRCVVGPTVGQAASEGQMSLLIGDSVRSGDSGGGVFDEQGRLVAVIWGEAQGVTYASFGKPLGRFLGRVLGRRTSQVYSCPGGVCPQRPVRPSQPRVDPRWNAFQRQLDELRAQKQDRGDYLTREELPSLGGFARYEDVERLESESATRHARLLERIQSLGSSSVGKVAGSAAVGLLGLSGPAGWMVIAAASVGGWLVGRRMKRRLRGAGGRRRRRFRE